MSRVRVGRKDSDFVKDRGRDWARVWYREGDIDGGRSRVREKRNLHSPSANHGTYWIAC